MSSSEQCFFLLTLHAYPILWPCTAESVGHLPLSQSFQEMGTSLSFHAAFHYPQHPGTCESHKANKQMYNQILESVKKKKKTQHGAETDKKLSFSHLR